ncbi:MAG: putative toxin-antitoxin system toxin component, PIN family [Flavobacteriales bacterium]|nr:putative toxin-antitoxin system toxin component, PIN family [Flavobacteriales bacterium]
MFGRIGMTSTTEVRLVVDINVLVSSLMHGELSGFSPVLADPRFQVFTSNEQLAELLDVVERPKFRKYFPLSEAREFFADFCLITEVVLVRAPLLPVCRDPKDDYLLALAKAAKAEI